MLQWWSLQIHHEHPSGSQPSGSVVSHCIGVRRGWHVFLVFLAWHLPPHTFFKAIAFNCSYNTSKKCPKRDLPPLPPCFLGTAWDCSDRKQWSRLFKFNGSINAVLKGPWHIVLSLSSSYFIHNCHQTVGQSSLDLQGRIPTLLGLPASSWLAEPVTIIGRLREPDRLVLCTRLSVG